MATIDIVCRKCIKTERVIRNGKASTGIQRFYCKGCRHSFQLDYRYKANQPGMHEKIITMTMEGMGVRSIGRTLETTHGTVINHLKSLSHHR